MVYYIVSGVLLMFFWRRFTAINVSVQYNGGLLLDIILLIDPMLFPSGNSFKCHEEVLYLQSLIQPKRFNISPPSNWGMLRRSRCVLIFLETTILKNSKN